MSETEIPVSGASNPEKTEESEAISEKPNIGSLAEKAKEIPQEELLDLIINAPKSELIPWEPMVLPSLGQYYDGAVPGGKVDVRPMGIQAEKILATQRLAQSGHSIDYLFKECVRLPNNFDPMNLLVGDRTFLLYVIRGITHGNIYEFSIACSNDECKRTSMNEYDLNLLNETKVSPTTNEPEPFKIILPNISKKIDRQFWVRVRFMRGYDAQQMLKRQKFDKTVNNKARNPHGNSDSDESTINIDQTIEQNLNLLVTEVMGDTSPPKIAKLISGLHSTDTAMIREFLKDNQPGIDTTIEITCPHCDNEMRMDLPLGEGFFRPAKARGTGT